MWDANYIFKRHSDTVILPSLNSKIKTISSSLKIFIASNKRMLIENFEIPLDKSVKIFL